MKRLAHPTRFHFSCLARLRPSRLLVVLFLLFAGATTTMAQGVVKGRVVNESGTPLGSATVQVKGTSTGTSSNANGEFSINASVGSTLVVSSIGYAEIEVTVTGNNLTVTLQAVAKDISEVVVVGYGTQKRKDVTGSVISVNEKALREVPSVNLIQALQGRAAGLEIQRVGNQPGAGGQIRIRGTRSITGSNEPLLVLDGIPFEGSLNDINPDDVVSVDILKDASATAIYGSRGANGVILVTTRRGRNGEVHISYNGYYGIGSVANKYPVFNSQEYMAMREMIPGNPYPYTAEEQKGIALGRNTDWQDLMYQNSYRTDHNISVSGGKDGNTFSFGGGYYRETSVLPGESFTRFTVRGAIDSRIGKHMKIGFSTQNILSYNLGSQFVSGAPLFKLIALTPLTPGYDSSGNVYKIPWGDNDDINSNDRYSPLYLKNNQNNWVDRVRRIRTIDNFYVEYEFIKGLRYRFNLGMNFGQQLSAQFQAGDLTDNPSYFRAAPVNTTPTGLNNTASLDNAESWGYTAENLLFYDKTINKHKFSFTGLFSTQEYQTFNTYVKKDSIDDNFIQFYSLSLSNAVSSANTTLGGGEQKWSLLSYMARLFYSFNDRYMITATFRRDGSSRLAKGNQWFNYPALSAAWQISDEPFMQHMNAINNLKLRVSWGKTSNQAINPYQSLGLVNNSNGLASPGNITRYNFGPTIVTGYNVVTLPNPNLSWEFTKVANLALDFSLLKNRISGSVEYYRSKTEDILYTVNLPVTSGVAGSFLTNVGEMSNHGFEFNLSTINYTSHSGFTWAMDLNLFANKNKLLRLTDNVTQDIGSQLFVGYPMSAIYDYKKLGIWQSSEAAEAALYGAVPGQIKLEDHSGPAGKPDGVINNTYDRYVIGDGDADLQGGMTQRFSFKGFDLSAVFYGRFGGLLMSQVHQTNATYVTVMDGRRNQLKVDYWTPTNPTNWFPMPGQAISPQSDAWRTLGYYDGSFVKLRSINLGYSLSPALVKRVNAQSARLYFTVDNVATLWSPYYKQTGIDPEGTTSGYRGVGSAVDNLRQGTNATILIGLGTPPRRTFTFGINVTF